ncbi:unnamed protein product [Arabis nemorensis]|uniref:Uncharacterized protein n=1 Tax=Arabis nemorensis TaxID=586526 RepID=A0A565BKG3_9BRAS|nr:unnamed protein product [Arabis nemorensis]
MIRRANVMCCFGSDLLGKDRKQRAQPGFDRPSCHWRVASDVPCRKLHSLHIRAEELASEEEEAAF